MGMVKDGNMHMRPGKTKIHLQGTDKGKRLHQDSVHTTESLRLLGSEMPNNKRPRQVLMIRRWNQ